MRKYPTMGEEVKFGDPIRDVEQVDGDGNDEPTLIEPTEFAANMADVLELDLADQLADLGDQLTDDMNSALGHIFREIGVGRVLIEVDSTVRVSFPEA